MPNAGRNLASEQSVSRGETDSFRLVAVVVIKNFIKPASEACDTFRGLHVPVDVNLCSGNQRIQHPLGIVRSGIAHIHACPQPFIFPGFGQQPVKQCIVNCLHVCYQSNLRSTKLVEKLDLF